MRRKGQDKGDQPFLPGLLDENAENSLMSEVEPVKVADGDDGPSGKGRPLVDPAKHLHGFRER
jgi:hypothetical protein